MNSLDRVKAAFEGIEYDVIENIDGTPCIEVKPEVLHVCVQLLFEVCGFEMNSLARSESATLECESIKIIGRSTTSRPSA